MKLSGFTFIHNAIEAGYPIIEAISMVLPFVDEIVVVDMESTDSTVDLIHKHIPTHFGKEPYLRIISGVWEPGQAGECLKKNHALYKECTGDVIVHFEADEVYDYKLVQTISNMVRVGHTSLKVHRLQVEQNFQRVRWYPELVHRVWERQQDVVKDGHTTNVAQNASEVSVVNGFLWDVTNCFRDNCIQRFKNQAELWEHKPEYKFTPFHGYMAADVRDEVAAVRFLQSGHWTWKSSPFKLPSLLERLVGVTNYGEYWDVS